MQLEAIPTRLEIKNGAVRNRTYLGWKNCKPYCHNTHTLKGGETCVSTTVAFYRMSYTASTTGIKRPAGFLTETTY